jgi:hypothetical protein
MGEKESVETVYWILEHLASNDRAILAEGAGPDGARFTRAGQSS